MSPSMADGHYQFRFYCFHRAVSVCVMLPMLRGLPFTSRREPEPEVAMRTYPKVVVCDNDSRLSSVECEDPAAGVAHDGPAAIMSLHTLSG